jgi:Tol biopolymer transport system component
VDLRTGATAELFPEIPERLRASYSPDGRLAFNGGPPWGIYVDGVLGLATENVMSPISLSAPAWSPDGRTLAVAAFVQVPGSLPVYDLYLMNPVTWTYSPLGPRDCEDPIYSPDGGLIAYERTDAGGTLWYATVPGGVETHLAGADSITPSHPAWSPDGTQLVVDGYMAGSLPTKLYLVDATTGAVTQLTAHDGNSPVWIP